LVDATPLLEVVGLVPASEFYRGPGVPGFDPEGHGLKSSARAAGIGQETGYRWLREAFVELREAGVGVVDAQQQLGYSSPLVLEWERVRLATGPDPRHHLAHEVVVEETFGLRSTPARAWPMQLGRQR